MEVPWELPRIPGLGSLPHWPREKQSLSHKARKCIAFTSLARNLNLEYNKPSKVIPGFAGPEILSLRLPVTTTH